MIGALRADALFMSLWRSCTTGSNNSRINNKINIDISSNNKINSIIASPLAAAAT
jgi:hypothetical protein